MNGVNPMRIEKSHLILLAINLAVLIGFGTVFAIRANIEFLLYVGVVLAAIIIIGLSLNKVAYTTDCLIAITIWAALHLAGGGIYLANGLRLYDWVMIPIIDHGGEWQILKYDQFAHIWGFASAVLLMRCLLENHLKKPIVGKASLIIVLMTASMGLGALNEIIEFIAATALDKDGVGGYVNTSLDLVSNMIGAAIACVYLGLRGRLR
jgi:hypothetical protein